MHEAVFKQFLSDPTGKLAAEFPVILYSRLQNLMKLSGPLGPWKASRMRSLQINIPTFFVLSSADFGPENAEKRSEAPEKRSEALVKTNTNGRKRVATPAEVESLLRHPPSAFLTMYDALRVAQSGRSEGRHKERLVQFLTEALEDYYARGIPTGYEPEKAFRQHVSKANEGDRRSRAAQAQAQYRARKKELGWQQVTILMPYDLVPSLRAAARALISAEQMHNRTLKEQLPKSQRRLDREHAAQSAHLKPDREHAEQSESSVPQVVDIDNFLEEDDFL